MSWKKSRQAGKQRRQERNSRITAQEWYAYFIRRIRNENRLRAKLNKVYQQKEIPFDEYQEYVADYYQSGTFGKPGDKHDPESSDYIGDEEASKNL